MNISVPKFTDLFFFRYGNFLFVDNNMLVQVERQCSHNVWQRPAQSVSKVSVTLYFESLCPDCQFFFSDQLIHAYLALSSILNLELVPYGNAQVSSSRSLLIVFVIDMANGGHFKFCCLGSTLARVWKERFKVVAG